MLSSMLYIGKGKKRAVCSRLATLSLMRQPHHSVLELEPELELLVRTPEEAGDVAAAAAVLHQFAGPAAAASLVSSIDLEKKFSTWAATLSEHLPPLPKRSVVESSAHLTVAASALEAELVVGSAEDLAHSAHTDC